jgi:hypothetical protein
MTLKDHIKGSVVFAYYKNNELWYLTESGLKFPVPISDCGEATFFAVDKGIFFMRWIRKQMTEIEEAKKV